MHARVTSIIYFAGIPGGGRSPRGVRRVSDLQAAKSADVIGAFRFHPRTIFEAFHETRKALAPLLIFSVTSQNHGPLRFA